MSGLRFRHRVRCEALLSRLCATVCDLARSSVRLLFSFFLILRDCARKCFKRRDMHRLQLPLTTFGIGKLEARTSILPLEVSTQTSRLSYCPRYGDARLVSCVPMSCCRDFGKRELVILYLPLRLLLLEDGKRASLYFVEIFSVAQITRPKHHQAMSTQRE